MGGSTVLDLPDGGDDGETAEVNLKRLVDLVTGSSKRIKVDGTNFSFERSAIREAVKAAILAGVKEKKRDEKDENKLEAPLSAVKTATKHIVGAAECGAGDCDGSGVR